MSGLLKYSTPAERLRGLSFSEIGGTFTGSNFTIYEVSGNELYSHSLTAQIIFYPEFNWDEDVQRTFIDTSATGRYLIYKHNNATDNRLICLFGGIIIISVSGSVYSPYWRVNERNVLIVTSSPGFNKMYLNGNLVGSSSTAWSPARSSRIHVGSLYTLAWKFVGEISLVKIIREELVNQEVLDIQNNSTYNYKNKYRIHYPMTQATHTGSQTLDVSGNNLHGTLVGAPTKLTGQGYNLDGSTQYITFPEQTFPGEFTLAIFSNPEMKTLDGFFGHTTDTNKMILFISGKVFVRVISTSDSTVDSNGAVVNFLGLTRDADNKVDLYVNQKRYRLFGDVAQVGDSVWDYIGKTESAAQNFTGDIFETIIDNKCLTPTQMHDLSLRRFALDI